MAAAYSLKPVETLGSGEIDDIRRIYETGFAPPSAASRAGGSPAS
jgi:hypothetical protein